MFIDTHCHINMMIKKNFDQPINTHELESAQLYIEQAHKAGVSFIINVGTSVIESQNCISLAKHYKNLFATVGIHPNDCTQEWKKDFNTIKEMVKDKEINKIVGIGECGIDLHYPNSDFKRQKDAFKAHIELALENNLALVIHSRDAYDETLSILGEFHADIKRATIHCFSYDLPFAQKVISWGFYIGIDAPITYPKNETLRSVVSSVGLDHSVLETDAPFLPPQHLRGKQNHPYHIKTIADYIANLLNVSFEQVASKTTNNALALFDIRENIFHDYKAL